MPVDKKIASSFSPEPPFANKKIGCSSVLPSTVALACVALTPAVRSLRRWDMERVVLSHVSLCARGGWGWRAVMFDFSRTHR